MTISIGVVGAAHWAYMAEVLATRLGDAVSKGKIDLKKIPRGILKEAQEFFGLVIQAIGDNLPDNPPASMNAYVIAADTVKCSPETNAESAIEIDIRLKAYHQFLTQLTDSGDLSGRQLQTAKDLRDFFIHLQLKGQSAMYESAIELDVPPLD